MTAINFPDSPSLNDTFTASGRQWTWNGSAWNAVGTHITAESPILYVDGEFTFDSTGFATETYVDDAVAAIPAPDYTGLATETYADTAAANAAAAIVDSAPTTLNTLNELAAALGDDANFATTITNAIAAKAPTNQPTLTSPTLEILQPGFDVLVASSDYSSISTGVYEIKADAPTTLGSNVSTGHVIYLTGTEAFTSPSADNINLTVLAVSQDSSGVTLTVSTTNPSDDFLAGQFLAAGYTDVPNITFHKASSTTTISSTEIGYLDGVTSNIQAQLNSVSKNFNLLASGSIDSFTSTSALNSIFANNSGYSSYRFIANSVLNEYGTASIQARFTNSSGVVSSNSYWPSSSDGYASTNSWNLSQSYSNHFIHPASSEVIEIDFNFPNGLISTYNGSTTISAYQVNINNRLIRKSNSSTGYTQNYSYGQSAYSTSPINGFYLYSNQTIPNFSYKLYGLKA